MNSHRNESRAGSSENPLPCAQKSPLGPGRGTLNVFGWGVPLGL